jgi:hypothetical protein
MIEIKKAWLTGETFAGEIMRKITMAPNGLAIDRSNVVLSKHQQPNGVMHTTEGHWNGSLNVFTDSNTPTFALGWHTITDNNTKDEGPFHLAQFMPIGEMAMTLVNDPGGTETNREALVQIEVVGWSKHDPWLFDEKTTNVLASLIDRLEEVCGIPLQRAGNGTRSVVRWDGKAGWFGHGEVPENGHWDPGELKWGELFAAAPNETDTFWEARSGGELLHSERAGGADQTDAYDRLITWLDGHEGVIRNAERENGQVHLMSAVRPIRG